MPNYLLSVIHQERKALSKLTGDQRKNKLSEIAKL